MNPTDGSRARTEAVRGGVAPVRHTHEQLARIRIEGDGLPAHLGHAARLRLAKVRGSVVDHCFVRNGYDRSAASVMSTSGWFGA